MRKRKCAGAEPGGLRGGKASVIRKLGGNVAWRGFVRFIGEATGISVGSRAPRRCGAVIYKETGVICKGPGAICEGVGRNGEESATRSGFR